MKIISFINEKGGVGKTTTVVNTAYSLAQDGHKVLMVDLDPQASATSIIGLGNGNVDNPDTFTSYDIFFNQFDSSKDIRHKYGVDVITADDRLAGVDVSGLPKEVDTTLAKFFKRSEFDYDFVLLDCKASIGLLTVNALVASTHFVAVTQSQHLSLEGLPKLFKTLNTIKCELGVYPQMLGILVTMFNKHLTHERDQIAAIQKSQFKSMLFDTIIRTNTAINRASHSAVPIGVYDNNSRGAIDYRNFASEFVKRAVKK